MDDDPTLSTRMPRVSVPERVGVRDDEDACAEGEDMGDAHL